MVKTIKLKHYNVSDKTKFNIEHLLNNLYSKFISEDNTNNLEDALQKLKDFIYVPSSANLWSGRYIRMIDTRKPMNMKIHIGGFLVHDNGYVFKLLIDGNIRKFNKKHFLTFMLFSQKDNFIQNLKKFY